MLILAPKVWSSFGLVTIKVQSFQLRNGDPQRILNPSETGGLRLFWSSGNLFQKIATIWVVLAPDRSIRFANQLGYDVKVSNLSEKFCNCPVFSVDVDLLQVGLRQLFWI